MAVAPATTARLEVFKAPDQLPSLAGGLQKPGRRDAVTVETGISVRIKHGDLGRFDHDRALFSRALESSLVREYDPLLWPNYSG